MTVWTFVLRSLRHYWRTHLGVVLGAAVATAVLVGALVVGDSVRTTLSDFAKKRIGRIDAALLSGERFFGSDLGARLASSAALEGVRIAPVLQLRGLARTTKGDASAGIVDVYGVDDAFFSLSPSGRSRAVPPKGAVINEGLAKHLGVETGQTILVRVEKPSAMPRDMVLSTIDDISIALRVKVDAIVGDEDFGRFSLRASQLPPFAVWVDLAWVQKELELGARANALFVGGRAEGSAALTATADEALREHWKLSDAELVFDVLDGQNQGLVEMTSERIFLDPFVVDAVRDVEPTAVGLLTYFVNTIAHGEKQTPYSMITALATLGDGEPADARLQQLLAIVAPLAKGEVVVSSWLRDDLGTEDGNRLGIDYYVMGSSLELLEKKSELVVRGSVPLAGVVQDPTLMPDFPGLADADSCRDWEPGVPVQLDRIRDQDEKYWEDHKGTPKAFVTGETGRGLWGNRFGSTTAIRGTKAQMERVQTELRQRLEPSRFGFFFRDLRTPALAGGTSATDFGGLFLGLSFFLILAALLLTALLFVFGVEQRAHEIGTLLAVGYQPRLVRRVFLFEASALAIVGSVIGAFLGLLYTRFVLWGLSTLWQDAVGNATLAYHANAGTILTGAGCGVVVALVAIWFALRKAFSRPALELLRSKSGVMPPAATSGTRSARTSLVWAGVFVLFAVVLASYARFAASAAALAGTFFGAGALLLVGGIFACRAYLLRKDADSSQLSIASLAARNAGRRRGRSLATIALLASGTFLVVAVQANRLEAPEDPTVRASGTGGFAFVGRATLPVLRDLASKEGREAFGLDEGTQAAKAIAGVEFVAMRVKEGDDASCLNLSLPQNPRLVSVDAAQLVRRNAFAFAAVMPPDGIELDEGASPWSLLDADYGPNVVPAIGDQASVTWTLHKSLGDGLEYHDESGKTFEVRIVATLSSSILQGDLVIGEPHFRARFPSASGYRKFLVDAPPETAATVRATLTDALEDIGLELTPTGARLAELNAVQNTYLVIFQLLGGLGLLLGSIGLGLVVLRNALERRSELALVSAVGFAQRHLRALIWREHAMLLFFGLSCGVVAALLALLPSLQKLSLTPLLVVLALLAASGALWVLLATRAAARGPLVTALRDE